MRAWIEIYNLFNTHSTMGCMLYHTENWTAMNARDAHVRTHIYKQDHIMMHPLGRVRISSMDPFNESPKNTYRKTADHTII